MRPSGPGVGVEKSYIALCNQELITTQCAELSDKIFTKHLAQHDKNNNVLHNDGQ